MPLTWPDGGQKRRQLRTQNEPWSFLFRESSWLFHVRSLRLGCGQSAAPPFLGRKDGVAERPVFSCSLEVMPRYLERGRHGGGVLPPLAATASLREELDRRRTATRLRVRASANRAFGDSLLYALSERTTEEIPEVATANDAIERSRRATIEAAMSRSSEAHGMVDAAIERARRAASEARAGAEAADALANQVHATLASLEQPDRAIVERAARRPASPRTTSQSPSRSVAFGRGTGGGGPANGSGGGGAGVAGSAARLSASERLASSRLDRASRTLSLMRERATMLQLVLQLSRQELDLNLQRMRMEEELELAMALSRSLGDDDTDAPCKPLGVPPELLEERCPQQSYAAAIAADRKARGADSHLPGGAECTVCQSNMCAHEEVRVLPCRHVFHKACCDPWFARSSCCPTCRADVLRVADEVQD